jgi:ribosomal protein L2
MEICDNQNASGETRLILLTCAATIGAVIQTTNWLYLVKQVEQDG